MSGNGSAGQKLGVKSVTNPIPPTLFQPPLSVTCFEYRRQMKGGTTAPFLVAATKPDRSIVQVVLKVRNPATPVGTGHYGGTSSACELICSAIASALGLTVPDYAIAEVGLIFANGIRDDAVRRVLAANLGPNFASVLVTPQQLRWNPDCSSLSFALRQAIDDVLSFDATVINGDRKRANPNLLWDGNETVHMIDHGLACMAHRWDDPTIASSPLLPDAEIQAHCGYAFLSGQSCSFDETTGRWRVRLNNQFWDDLRASIPSQWELRTGDLDRIFRFLRARFNRLADIVSELRRVVR